jgi:hypothetical protein
MQEMVEYGSRQGGFVLQILEETIQRIDQQQGSIQRRDGCVLIEGRPPLRSKACLD